MVSPASTGVCLVLVLVITQTTAQGAMPQANPSAPGKAPCKVDAKCIMAMGDHWGDFVRRKRHDAVRRE